jgi:excisionase family DNA binding protein
MKHPNFDIRNLSGNANERLMRFLQATPSDSGEGFEPFITKAVVAERLDVKLRTVSRLMRRRVLRHYKLGELVRFKWSEVESDVREHFRVCFDPKGDTNFTNCHGVGPLAREVRGAKSETRKGQA